MLHLCRTSSHFCHINVTLLLHFCYTSVVLMSHLSRTCGDGGRSPRRIYFALMLHLCYTCVTLMFHLSRTWSCSNEKVPVIIFVWSWISSPSLADSNLRLLWNWYRTRTFEIDFFDSENQKGPIEVADNSFAWPGSSPVEGSSSWKVPLTVLLV